MSKDLSLFCSSFFFLFTCNLAFCLDSRELEGAVYYRYHLKIHRDAGFKVLLPLHRVFLDGAVSYAVPNKCYALKRV